MITNTRTRTRADRLGDGVSLVVLLALGAFAIAVSFSHTMDFVRAHGQSQRWIVVGTACTVVGLTVQSGMEVWRDRRDGRPAGWPAALLTVGVVVELFANAYGAQGALDKVVAAWPVPVAAAALHIWTRRLASYAAAEEGQPLVGDPGRRIATVPDTVPEEFAPYRNGANPAPGAAADELEAVDAAAGRDRVEEDQDVVDDRPLADRLGIAVDDLEGETVKEKGAALLRLYPGLRDVEIAEVLGCSERYGRQIRSEADARPPAVVDQVPGQLDMLAGAAA